MSENRTRSSDSSPTHRVVVHQLDQEVFWALCDCGWNMESRATREEAFADAYGHDAHVEREVEVDEEGGVGWSCFFCGSSIESSPVRVILNWTESGEEVEQFFATHRECLIQHASADHPRDSPLFDT